MIAVSVYDKTTNQIISNLTCSRKEDLSLNVPAGHDYIDGHYDPETHEVQNGVAVKRAVTPSAADQWSALRRQRDALLAACDWTQMPDNPDPLKSQWATYRQALRDLPANTTDPANPVWPTQPA